MMSEKSRKEWTGLQSETAAEGPFGTEGPSAPGGVREPAAQERRAHYRQQVSVPAMALCVNSMLEPGRAGGEEMTDPVPCEIRDISVGGALIACREARFSPGDWLFLTDAWIGDDPEPFLLTCRVQRVSEGPGGDNYGCRIEGLDDQEQDRLLGAIFSIQRKQGQARRNRDREQQ